jgi:hypothetical protein
LGPSQHVLDFDLDIVFSHIFPHDAAGLLPTKRVLNPLKALQGSSPDLAGMATAIANVLATIPKVSNPLRWVELDIKFRRHASVPTGTGANASTVAETMLLFHERFWFRF